MHKEPFEVSYLKERFSYDPETGAITSLVSSVNRNKGAIAKARDKYGYIQVSLHCKNLKAHRVAWALYYGEWPKGEVDHENGIKDDNRISNLRSVSHGENMKNQRLNKQNKTGYNGVFYEVSRNKYQAALVVEKKKHHLGRYDTAEEAGRAVEAAKEKFGFHPNHGK